MKINLQKFIADSGYCARRKAGDLIKDGKVKVNGGLAELGMKVDENDKVEIVGRGGKTAISKKEENFVYIKLNKPAGYTCTNRKFQGEKNVFDLVKPISTKHRLFTAGRLDKNSRGLVLLTNDGELVHKLTHPSFEHEKKYLVSVGIPSGRGGWGVKNNDIKLILEKFKSGINIEDGIVKAKEIKYLKNNTFSIILTTGKKRQIREMFKKLGYKVEDLLRIKISSLALGNLKEGDFEILNEGSVKNLTTKI
jgi:pseudouridine synthase